MAAFGCTPRNSDPGACLRAQVCASDEQSTESGATAQDSAPLGDSTSGDALADATAPQDSGPADGSLDTTTADAGGNACASPDPDAGMCNCVALQPVTAALDCADAGSLPSFNGGTVLDGTYVEMAMLSTMGPDPSEGIACRTIGPNRMTIAISGSSWQIAGASAPPEVGMAMAFWNGTASVSDSSLTLAFSCATAPWPDESVHCGRHGARQHLRDRLGLQPRKRLRVCAAGPTLQSEPVSLDDALSPGLLAGIPGGQRTSRHVLRRARLHRLRRGRSTLDDERRKLRPGARSHMQLEPRMRLAGVYSELHRPRSDLRRATEGESWPVRCTVRLAVLYDSEQLGA
jgi:hypothetical protein